MKIIQNLSLCILLFYIKLSIQAQDFPKMIEIPGGTFIMGSENIQAKDSNPKHKVKIDTFYMDMYEVTQGDYEYLLKRNPVATQENIDMIKQFEKNSQNFHIPIAKIGAKYPIIWVSWYDAVKYCNARSKKEGFEPCYDEETWECDFAKNGYRLPTEAEWEYACRAGSNKKYFFGDEKKKLIEYANYWPEALDYNKMLFDASIKGNKIVWNKPYAKLIPVGGKKPNEWGLYDMLGNANEWCNDWYDPNYYEKSPKDNPKGPKSGENKVIRGWSFKDSDALIYWRDADFPRGKVGAGFRCVRNAPKEEKAEEKPVKPEEPQPDNKKE